MLTKEFWFRRQHEAFGRYFSKFDIALIIAVIIAVFWVRFMQILIFGMLGMAIILHEVAHGKMAEYLGDPTAKNLGRLSLNPLVHVDPMGTVFLPLILVFSGAPFLFGWAKPVPVDPRYFKDPIGGMMWVALAGPITNIVLAAICIGCIHILMEHPVLGVYTQMGGTVLMYGAIINCVLAVFNMIPIPPLDGSRVVLNFLPQSAQIAMMRLEPYGLFIVMGLVYFGAFDGILNWTIQQVLGLLGVR